MTEPTLLEVLHDGFVRLERWDDNGFTREVVRTTDSACGLLIDMTNRRVLLISQSRVPMRRDDNPEGISISTVAGRFDKDLGPKALLVDEALAEAGVTITQDDVQLLNMGVPMYLSSGVLTERSFIAVALIHPKGIAHGDTGLGDKSEGEDIDRVWVPINTLIHPDTMFSSMRTWALAQWLARAELMTMINELRDHPWVWSGSPADLTGIST